MDLYETIRHRERAAAQLKAELEQARQTEITRQQALQIEQQRSPADRLIPGREDQMQQARERKADPAPELEEKTKVAEQMKAQPTGLQRAPSPGGPGVTYSNPRVWPPLDQTRSHIEPLFDQASRRRDENRAARTEQELANDRHERAQRDLDRFLDLPRR